MVELINNTPIEEHDGILVKREDLSCPSPGPPFSKMRGLMKVLIRLKDEGTEIVAYTETPISMAGWGVAWGAAQLGMKAVIFEPIYTDPEPDLIKYHKKQWNKFGADIVPIKASRARVNFYTARKVLKKEYGPKAVMLPLALNFPEAVDANEAEAIRTRASLDTDIATLVICVGSGTIVSGVLRAFPDKTIYGIMAYYGKNKSTKRRNIERKSGAILVADAMWGVDLHLVNPGWAYRERSTAKCPFPCHPYYDLKAWQWLMENRNELDEPILFWNIGRMK